MRCTRIDEEVCSPIVKMVCRTNFKKKCEIITKKECNTEDVNEEQICTEKYVTECPEKWMTIKSTSIWIPLTSKCVDLVIYKCILLFYVCTSLSHLKKLVSEKD